MSLLPASILPPWNLSHLALAVGLETPKPSPHAIAANKNISTKKTIVIESAEICCMYQSLSLRFLPGARLRLWGSLGHCLQRKTTPSWLQAIEWYAIKAWRTSATCNFIIIFIKAKVNMRHQSQTRQYIHSNWVPTRKIESRKAMRGRQPSTLGWSLDSVRAIKRAKAHSYSLFAFFAGSNRTELNQM